MLLLAAVLLALVLAAAGCDMPSTGGLGQVYGSGTPATRTYDYTGFTKVEVDSGFVATVEQGDSYAVSVTADDNLVKDKLKIELDGDTLHIGLAPLWQFRDVTLKATVTLPHLTGLDVSGASTVDAAPTGDDLDLAASGASTVTLTGQGKVTLDVSGASRADGAVLLDELAGDVSGASVLAFTGNAGTLRLDVSGGSRLDLMDLAVQTADLTLSGGSRGEVTVAGTLDAEASGGSRLEYAGDPQLGAVDVSGGSAVEPAGN
jgi:Putative auto-transporter adhesin, head GIN domain